MKKSRLLHNPKDLLSRSFNPAKCKTSLRLAGSRLKLLRNKKEVQLKQMNREIAQLLESGQDQTARIRVEHVIREEKMMAAYDLLEIYCELAVARLPIIESQKNCPIDLKEAIASLVFAAPGCGDVPELLDVRKQITSKYGKDFTTAATELRPQCGVGRMLIEKLSATAPNGQTKLKFLSAIAEGHNVKWDPKSFGDKDYVSQNDPQGEPSSLTKESEQYAKTPHFEAAQGQARPNNNNVMMQTSPSNFSLQDDRTSVAPEKLVSALTAVRVYTVCDESKYLIVRNVPSLGCGGELLKVFSTYGQIEECKPMDAEECEMYTDVYWIKFHQVSNARFAKRKLDESVFLGNRIRVSYAPEYESLSDTKEKLDGRRKEVLARLNPRRSKGPSDSPNEPSSVPTPSVAQQLKEPEIAATRQTSSNILPSNHNQEYFPLESMNRTVHLVREKLNKIQYSVGNTEPASSKRICVHNRRRI